MDQLQWSLLRADASAAGENIDQRVESACHGSTSPARAHDRLQHDHRRVYRTGPLAPAMSSAMIRTEAPPSPEGQQSYLVSKYKGLTKGEQVEFE
ncbi:MAG: hypothetical protein Q8Q02_13690 [Nocardioides sp.]|nr:hypothetical protein [Nocardioides sp.]